MIRVLCVRQARGEDEGHTVTHAFETAIFYHAEPALPSHLLSSAAVVSSLTTPGVSVDPSSVIGLSSMAEMVWNSTGCKQGAA